MDIIQVRVHARQDGLVGMHITARNDAGQLVYANFDGVARGDVQSTVLDALEAFQVTQATLWSKGRDSRDTIKAVKSGLIKSKGG